MSALLAEALAIVQSMVFSAAAALFFVATREYRGTPWGTVLVPFVPGLVFFAGVGAITALHLPPRVGGTLATVCWSLGVVCVTVATVRFVNFAMGRVQL